MKRRIPPFNWVRGFEAAARLGSFVAAADEFSVSAGAISRSVKELEDFLGINLFIRRARGVQLTKEGRAYAEELAPALEQLAVATERVMDPLKAAFLKISIMPALGECWLVPRLGKFSSIHPEISTEMVASTRLVDLCKSDFDLALRYGDGDFPGLVAHELFDDKIFPVTSPELMSTNPLKEPRDLFKLTALQDSIWESDWKLWFSAVGEKVPTEWPRTSFSLYSMAVNAAKAGQGVLMGHERLIEAEIESGALVAPFDTSVSCPKRYYLVYAPERELSSVALKFIEWVYTEIGRQQDFIDFPGRVGLEPQTN